MRNLVLVAAGDQSLHPLWYRREKQFDLWVAYYGDKTPQPGKCDYYCQFKGTKFKIVQQVAESQAELLRSYDYVFIPDDDLYMEVEAINQLFSIMKEYDLLLAQPSIIGWYSLLITLCVPGSLLRYTNWVEIMCPCFERSAFEHCKETFTKNDTNWGIEWLWAQALGNPKDKIAIVDAIAAIHTRPCFFGDTYQNNNNSFEKALGELNALREKHEIREEATVYETVPISASVIANSPSENRFYPPIPKLEDLFKSFRWKAPLHI